MVVKQPDLGRQLVCVTRLIKKSGLAFLQKFGGPSTACSNDRFAKLHALNGNSTKRLPARTHQDDVRRIDQR